MFVRQGSSPLFIPNQVTYVSDSRQDLAPLPDTEAVRNGCCAPPDFTHLPTRRPSDPPLLQKKIKGEFQYTYDGTLGNQAFNPEGSYLYFCTQQPDGGPAPDPRRESRDDTGAQEL
ncbi:unnamed protein product [Symbiodinium sp. CCMP2592]|nr:unnamed protein product [Symbiodinium sp. CCMP2592]